MTSRERILAALNHQPTDRIPIDFGGTRQSGIAVIAYHLLRQHLNLPTTKPARVFDLFQMLAEIDQDVADRFGADCVGLYRPDIAFGIPNRDWKTAALFDGTPVEVPGGYHPVREPDGDLVLFRNNRPVARMPHNGFYFDRLEQYPGATLITLNPPPSSTTPTKPSSLPSAHPTNCSTDSAQADSRTG
ncbi:MAG: hypothetical protein RI897_2012 [Verrucomicrobiota bacterium]